ncbi:GntR family transcriptional regulator [Actinoallomurus soli]|uniref:hypothetical protein n=1 Tax=Actinoallomurus soli TaxID=2952535 RepID=UPI0020934957|nr:hypothetical protein [Actinoallomurus soli]MCO5968605.1 hypothetical protein [Actinoallomurus soli]
MLSPGLRQTVVCGADRDGRLLLAPILRTDRRAVHRALSHLERVGYLGTVPGKGTYVRPPADWPPNPAAAFQP